MPMRPFTTLCARPGDGDVAGDLPMLNAIVLGSCGRLHLQNGTCNDSTAGECVEISRSGGGAAGRGASGPLNCDSMGRGPFPHH